MLSHRGATGKMCSIIYVSALKWVKKGTDFKVTWCYLQNSAFEQL